MSLNHSRREEEDNDPPSFTSDSTTKQGGQCVCVPRGGGRDSHAPCPSRGAQPRLGKVQGRLIKSVSVPVQGHPRPQDLNRPRWADTH
eukprot:scaffold49877_cov66-Phaeocystis_antarctica.AAC.5